MTAVYITLWILFTVAGLALIIGAGVYHREIMRSQAMPGRCGCSMCNPKPSDAGSFRTRQAKAVRRASRREIEAMMRKVEREVAG